MGSGSATLGPHEREAPIRIDLERLRRLARWLDIQDSDSAILFACFVFLALAVIYRVVF